MYKIYLIAGENSGDFIGAHIMHKLYHIDSEIKFYGIGGKLMQQAGLNDNLFPMEDINLMGFIEIIPKIFKIKNLLDITIKDILKIQPDILITIDSPGFTYRVAEKLKNSYDSKIKLLHIVAPSVWAYKPNRAKKYATIYDYLFTLLPFEAQYFTPLGLHCTYIGHPILEQHFYSKNKHNQPLTICVTPGSRKNEIIQLAPIFIGALNLIAKQYKDLVANFIIVNNEHKELLLPLLKTANFHYSFPTDKLKTFANSNFAIAKSGTNTLEISASKTPLVIAYKINYLSYLLIKFMIKVRFASLINIIANQMIIPEFIQNDCHPQKIANKIIEMINNPSIVNDQVRESIKILEELGLNNNISPSEKAANTIINILENK